MKRMTMAMTCAALFAALGLEAAAFDATGTWQGAMKCKLVAGDIETVIDEPAAVLQVTQTSDTDVFMTLQGAPYDGIAFASEGQEGRGTLGALRCENDGDAFTGTAESIFFHRVVVDEAKGVFELRGTSTMQGAAGAGNCTYKLARTSPADPALTDCNAP